MIFMSSSWQLFAIPIQNCDFFYDAPGEQSRKMGAVAPCRQMCTDFSILATRKNIPSRAHVHMEWGRGPIEYTIFVGGIVG